MQVIEAATTPGRLTTRLWLYNDGATTIHITPDDITLALGYAENPPGPRIPAAGIRPFDVLPGQAVDLILVWRWGGEPFGSLEVGGWRFGLYVAN